MASRADERTRLEVARDWHGPSPKRFQGWEPTWVTTYEYDDDGRLTRSVTKMAEPEWDDGTRTLVEGLGKYDRDCCPGCGLHASILADPETHRFTFEDDLCAVCKAKAAYGRVVAAKDEAAGKHLKGAPPLVPRPGDGRHIYLRPLTEAEREKTKEAGRG